MPKGRFWSEKLNFSRLGFTSMAFEANQALRAEPAQAGVRLWQISERAGLILALILPIFAIAPLFYPGYIQTHQGLAILWNVADFKSSPDFWGWLPHVAAHFDPVRGDGLLPYYLAGLLPFDPMLAVKIVSGLGWLLGSIGMFLGLKNWVGAHGALIAALVYIYLPYHIATVYVRGAWGEALFLGVLPWAIFIAAVPGRWPKFVSFLGAVFVWLLLGLSQLGLTIWAFIFLTLLALILYPGQAARAIIGALSGVILATGVMFSRFFPPGPTSFVRFTEHFLYPYQLFSAYWGTGASRPGWNDGLSFQLGLAAVGLTILSIWLWQGRRLSDSPIKRTDPRLIFFLGAALVLGFLQFSPAAFIWQVSPGSDYSLSSTLTYPWQLLGLVGLCLAVLSGTVFWLDRGLTHLPLLGAVVILVILSSYPYLLPQFMPVESYNLGQGPEAELGEGQLVLLSHDFSVSINGNTAGLAQGETTIPLAVSDDLQANQVLWLNVVWHPLQTFNQDWKIFVHLVDQNNHVLAQYDGPPQSGDTPTSSWVPGDFIEDSYPLPFPAEASPGPYRVFVGLYNQANMARLPVTGDPEGRVIFEVR